MSESAQFALIIPAHNEEAVIARCLKTALSGAPAPSALEIIVAANGCTDTTIDTARLAAPSATVLDLAKGSKTGAINAANNVATAYPRIVLDADVECDFRSLCALAKALRAPRIKAAAPAIRIDLSHGNRWIKAYYSAWMQQPFAKSGKGGAGCYGLSKAGLEQIGEFPDIVGDDIWIHTRFPDGEKAYVSEDGSGQPVCSIVRPPSTAWEQVKVEVRRILGNAVVEREYPSPHYAASKSGGGLQGMMKSGAAPFDLLVFFCVKVMVRLEMRRRIWLGQKDTWTRDQSSRQQVQMGSQKQ